ncbi:DUF2796 domain-containing protein [Vibrio tubiashii]|uniref:Zinc-binding protein n=1 Tax=Vibrio tubiashii ATCC 19109 TaxID=1051646 RepID=F9TAH3_9VIBR|nr:DUF2796 domain-containing protein [Vibrio tubiashii]AIW15184.1 zinc-binding protein [Vibrio tubiashii ATCC 19109]EGU49918.1 hypothetical protein VITU9109_07986 [Vibrio tubiashii ATCC 19109]EIF01447.1 zinc-binding protein [Vibrio tubiashii NCIMB 1337 = ATCC 19106]
MKNITPIALGITLAVSGIAQACEGGFRQHGAHVHGEVELNIAQDGKELLIEITAPGADVVGFEHAPKTDEQKHQLEDAIAKLNNASSVFTLASSAGCKVVHQSVSHTLGADNHDHDHDHDDHKGHDHHDEHKGHDHQEHGGHGEFTVEYHYACDDISTLSNIDTQWFTQFPNTEKLKVNVLTETKQASLELGKGDSKISL